MAGDTYSCKQFGCNENASQCLEETCDCDTKKAEVDDSPCTFEKNVAQKK